MDYQNILILSCRLLAFTPSKDFFKTKRTSLLASFYVWFLKKIISLVIYCYLTKFHYLVSFTLWNLGQYVHCNCLLTTLWRDQIWNPPYLSNQAVFSRWTNVRTNIWISSKGEELLKSDSHLPKKNFICFNDTPSKMMKNAFYFILKALFVLKIFKYLSWLFGRVEKTTWLER